MSCKKGATSWEKAFRAMPTHGVNIDDALADCELRSIATAKNGGPYLERRECCSCPETRIGNKCYALHRPQDCQYSVARSSLVPKAERLANRVVIRSADEGGGESHAAWMKVFCAEMEKLSRPLLNGASSNGESSNAHVEAQSIVPPGPLNDETTGSNLLLESLSAFTWPRCTRI
jgi:hypothetical protein